MKRILPLFLLLAFISHNASAAEGYKIQLKYTDIKDSMVYLVHYFAKPLPNIYRIDSAKINSKGVAVFEHKEKITGGIYMMLLSDRKTYFEFLLDDGADFTITVTASDLPASIKFKGSAMNEDFNTYQHFLSKYGKEQQALQDQLKNAKTHADTAAVQEKGKAASKSLTAYRRAYSKEHPGSLMANLFNALELPEVPEGTHYLPDGKVDSFFAYKYYKKHYWDKFDFEDDRLIHAPLLDARLEEYFNKLVVPTVDSVVKEADTILDKMKYSENLFKYTLNWLASNAQASKIMGMEGVFVYLVDNYFERGYARWLDSAGLAKYATRAEELRPTLPGRPAHPITMKGMDGKNKSLYDVKSKYTLVVFWSPECGHCIHEVPLLDSVYRAELKARGVTIYAAITEHVEEKWKDFVAKHHLEEWVNVWDPNNTSGYWSYYDVKTTPSIYLLDENKLIKGKKLDHTNVIQMIDIVERQKKEKEKEGKP
jgi:thiol-disulfide isomerase/thioredoxin